VTYWRLFANRIKEGYICVHILWYHSRGGT